MLYAEILLREVVQWQVPNSNAKLILLIIADHTDSYGIAYPTIKRLCDLSGLSKSSVIRAVNYCVEHGYLTKIAGRTGVSTIYQFTYLKKEGGKEREKRRKGKRRERKRGKKKGERERRRGGRKEKREKKEKR